MLRKSKGEPLIPYTPQKTESALITFDFDFDLNVKSDPSTSTTLYTLCHFPQAHISLSSSSPP